MIDTSYLPLSKAAEILNTDPDALLVAGIEGRIRLYGLLGEYVTLTSGLKLLNTDDQNPEESYGEEIKNEWIDFFPLARTDCASILKTGSSLPIYWISADDDTEQWQIFGAEEASAPEIIIQKSSVFILKKDVEKITSEGTPAKDAVREIIPRSTSHENRKINNQLRVIAALMDIAGLSTKNRGTISKVSRKTELNGVAVGPDTVSKIFKDAETIADNDSRKG